MTPEKEAEIRWYAENEEWLHVSDLVLLLEALDEARAKAPPAFTLSVDGRVLGTVKPATLDIEPFDEQ